jgi:N-acetyl-alpha-D-muramate 1-phosphate uridylyltransferase
MKAMILAAGRGERMRPLTDKVPKPLLTAGGEPLIVHLIKALTRTHFADLVINHSYLGHEIERELGDGAKFGVRICYSAEPEEALETGGGIYRALPLLGEVFLVVNGDVWTDYPFARLRQPPSGLAHVVLVDNPPHHPRGDFAFVDGAISDAQYGEPRLTFAGIGVYRAALFDGCNPGRFSLAPLLRRAIGYHQVSAEHYHGRWMDIGTPERLNALDALLTR